MRPATCSISFDGDIHLFLYNIVYLGVVERVSYVVGIHCLRYVIFHAYIYYVVIAGELLLRQHTMTRVQTNVVYMYERFHYLN